MSRRNDVTIVAGMRCRSGRPEPKQHGMRCGSKIVPIVQLMREIDAAAERVLARYPSRSLKIRRAGHE